MSLEHFHEVGERLPRGRVGANRVYVLAPTTVSRTTTFRSSSTVQNTVALALNSLGRIPQDSPVLRKQDQWAALERVVVPDLPSRRQCSVAR